MKALILNSGLGSRMGMLTSEHPKCMTEVVGTETILSRQLRMLSERGISDIVITTGLFDSVLVNYCRSLELPLHFTFVNNPAYRETNYIYSIYCAREYLREDDVLLMHGDIVFEDSVIDDVLGCDGSCMTVSSTAELPQKDFKAEVHEGRIINVGIEFFNSSWAAQPLYKLTKVDWNIWLGEIESFCERGEVKCYAEKALNAVSTRMGLRPLDVHERLCCEVDDPQDLAVVTDALKRLRQRTVYMSFSTDILHSGHIALIQKAKCLGRLIIGVMTDEAVASFQLAQPAQTRIKPGLFKNLKTIKHLYNHTRNAFFVSLRRKGHFFFAKERRRHRVFYFRPEPGL